MNRIRAFFASKPASVHAPLPPSLQAMHQIAPMKLAGFTAPQLEAYVRKVAAEACRLQRAADIEWHSHLWGGEPPLVVER